MNTTNIENTVVGFVPVPGSFMLAVLAATPLIR